MKEVFLVAILAAVNLLAQSSGDATTQPAAQTAASDEVGDDRYPALKEEANRRRARWQTLDEDTFTKDLPKIKDPCSPKIRPLISKVSAAMESYVEAYAAYTTQYAEDIKRQVKALKNTLAGQQSDLQASSALLADAQKDYDETKRRRDLLAQGGDANAEAVKEADALLARMNDSQETMKKIKADLEEMQSRGQTTEAAVAIKDETIGQLNREIDTLKRQYRTYYEKRTETYEFRCANGNFTAPPPPPVIDFGSGKTDK